jgi:hypothetical protein
VTLAEDNEKTRDAVLRSLPTNRLLAELQRRSAANPMRGVSRLTARALVGMFRDDHDDDCRIEAVMLTADAAQVGICWLDRRTIEAKLRVTFTDEQWQRVAEHLEDFDEWMENSGADESISTFVHDHLPRQAGLRLELDEAGKVVIEEAP